MLDRILQNFTWKDWCSKWELTYAFFHTFPTSFFPRSKLKFFHGLSVSVFFPEGLGPRGFRHLAVAQYRCAWRRLDPGNLSQTVQGGTWGMVNLNQIRRDDIPIYIYIFIIYTTYIYIPHPGCNCGIERFCLGFPRFLTWHSGWGLHPRFALLGTDTIPYQPALLRSCQGVEVLESIPVSVRVGPRKTAVGWPSQSFPPSTCPFFFEKVQGTSDFK